MKSRILIVEDEMIEAMNFEQSLTSFGYDVVGIASTGEDALKKVAELKPDLILMDIILKEQMNGIEVASKVKDEFDIPVIYLTAHPEESAVKRAKLTSPYGYLIKPVSKTELKNTIEIALYKHKMENELKYNENRYRSLFNYMSSGVAVYTAFNNGEDFIIIDFNESAENIESIKKEEVIGKKVTDAFPGVKDFGLFEVFQRVYKTGSPEHHPITQYMDKRITGWRDNFVYKLPSGEIVSVYDDVTKSKQAEEAMKESEERYRMLYLDAPLPYQSLNKNGCFIDVNPAWLDILGYSREDVVGKWFGEFLSPDYVEHFKENFPKFKSIGEIHDVEFEMVKKNGSTIFVTFDGRIGYDDEGRFKQTHCIFQDINEQKKAEKSLKESEERFRTVSEFTYDWEYWVGPDGKLLYVSPSCERITGYKPEEFIQDPGLLEEIIHPQDVEKVGEHLNEISNTEESTEIIEFRIINKQGDERWIGHGCQPVYSDKGEFLGRRVSNRDITSRKKSEDELRFHHEICENINEGVVLVRISDSVIVYANPKFEEMFGYGKDELLGMNVAKINAPTDMSPEEVANNIISNLRKNRVWSGEIYNKKKDGTYFWCYANVSTFKHAEYGEVWLSVLSDITEHKKTEDSLNESEANFKAIAENANDGILIATADGNHVYANKKVSEITGYPIPELLKTKISDLAHPEELQKLIKAFKRRLEEKSEPSTYETIILRKDKKAVPIELTASQTIWKGQKADLVIIRDIMERKKSEKEIKESLREKNKLILEIQRSKDELQTLIDNIVDEVWFCDKKGNILLTNAAAQKFDAKIKETSKNIDGLIDVVEVLDADGNPRPHEGSPLLRSLNGEILTDLEEIVIFPDKTKQYRQVSSAPIYNEKKIICGAVAVVRDITELKKVDEALKESKEFLDDIVENIPNMIFVKNAEDLSFKKVNRIGEIYFGHSSDELVGKSDYDFFPKDEADFFTQKDREVLQSKKLLDIPEETIETKILGPRLLHTKKIPLLDKEGNPEYLLGISEDITELKIAEKKIKESLKEKENLLKEIHHRVKNNLQIISSLLDLQVDYVKDDPAAVNVLIESQNRVLSMAMIHEMLYQSEDLSSINFSSYLRNLISNLYISYGVYNVQSIFNVDETHLNMETSIPLGLITSELVSNCLKYAFPNKKPGKLTISLKNKNDHHELIIKDNGIGFPEDLDFRNIESSLGLKLVISLVNQINGTIEQEISQGTKYTIRFKELKYKERI